ncbi:hypothetical protein KC356_g9197 [Hortaea werneckii]|nr:hypothetical protein KC356_g9197 [Hortaea werneckii]
MPAGVCHSVRVQSGDRTVRLKRPFANKKHAKEKICKQAWSELLEMDQQLPKKRKISQTQQARSGSVSMELLNSENFIGLLQDCAQANRHQLPYYSESRTVTVPIRFACTDRMRAAPPSVRRIKTEISSPEQFPEDHTGLTQMASDTEINAPDTASDPARLHEFALSLGFSQQIYESHPSVPPPDQPLMPHKVNGAFIDMCVRFCERDIKLEPRLAAPIARVQHVHGKKKAKDL